MSRWVVPAVLVCLLVSPPVRADDEAEARAHLEKAKVHYNLREFDAAVREFKEAYRIKSKPGLLFNIGQAERQAGNYPSAKFFYERYLAALPKAPNAGEVQTQIAQLERLIAESARPPAKAVLAEETGKAPEPKPGDAPPELKEAPTDPAESAAAEVKTAGLVGETGPASAPVATAAFVPAPVAAAPVSPAPSEPVAVTPAPDSDEPTTIAAPIEPEPAAPAPEPRAPLAAAALEPGPAAPPSEGGSLAPWIVGGLAAAALGAGGFFGLQSNAAIGEAQSAGSARVARDLETDARGKAFLANASFGAGGALALASAVMFVLQGTP